MIVTSEYEFYLVLNRFEIWGRLFNYFKEKSIKDPKGDLGFRMQFKKWNLINWWET